MGSRTWLALWTLVLAQAAWASEADAVAISQNIQARHFPYFTVLDPIFGSPTGNQVTGYTRCGDSALWTGFYLAAEAFRYSVTHSSDALADARRAFDGIQSLVDVTGNNVLARCLAPDDSAYAAGIQSEEAANGIYHSAPGNFWVGNTSRDQYSGVIFGLGVAYDLIDDAALRNSIAAVVTRLVRFLEDHWWSVVLPDGTQTTTFLYRPDQQLAFLQLARHVNPGQFSTSYDLNRVLLAPLAAAPIGVDTLSDGSYFKFNLDTVSLYTLIRLESSTFGDVYRQAYQILRDHTAGQANAFFNMVDRALGGPDTARDADTVRFLNEWLQRPRRDLFVDNRGKYPSCGDPNAACQPMPIPDRITTDFLWQRSPYQLANLGGDNLIEGAGIDYILPYWMARYYGVIGPDHRRIGSAASGAATLAAEEIASIFGLNLAVPAARAAADTSSLEGVSVTVKDSLAASRPAPLYYVSPGQVNLVVPAGTAPGTASFTVHSAGAADVTVSAPIATVAPGLFAADGSGTGVAAATAIRVVAGRQSPVAVFSCAGTSCSAAPIELGVDTPVFLTLYGTGIRHRSSPANVTCTIGGLPEPVTYAGPQLQYPGLDQVNVALPLSLRGLGPVTVTVTVDGQRSNPVSIEVQ